MDFLMLLPNGVRVVLEVDGKQHYAGTDSKADPDKYAAMAAADRDLRLFRLQPYAEAERISHSRPSAVSFAPGSAGIRVRCTGRAE